MKRYVITQKCNVTLSLYNAVTLLLTAFLHIKMHVVRFYLTLVSPSPYPSPKAFVASQVHPKFPSRETITIKNLRAVTIISDNDSYEARSITIESDNDFHEPGGITKKR